MDRITLAVATYGTSVSIAAWFVRGERKLMAMLYVTDVLSYVPAEILMLSQTCCLTSPLKY